MIRNKIKVDFTSDEANWIRINFSIYNEILPELIEHAINKWLNDNIIAENTRYEVIFAHTIERDECGVAIDQYFEPIYTETQIMCSHINSKHATKEK